MLYKWYGKCFAAGIYPFGSMLQEEALKIKESLKLKLEVKVRLTAAFFVNAAGQNVDESVIIWKSKKLRCFRNMKNNDLSRPLGAIPKVRTLEIRQF